MHEAFFQVLEVERFALLNEGIDNIHLSAQLQLVAQACDEALAVVLSVVNGLDGLAAGRQFVDDGYVKVAVNRHSQCARNGGGRHHEDVGWGGAVLLPQGRALLHAKAVLLVHDGQSEIPKLHLRLDEGVCAHEDVHLACGGVGQDGAAGLALDVTREEFDADARHAFEEFAKRDEVLLGQYLGGRHQHSLIPIVDGDEAGEEGHQRLARPHIALQQAVHLQSALHVGVYLVDDPLLCSREREGQVGEIERVELLANAWTGQAACGYLARQPLADDVQLEEEEFLKLHPACGLAHIGCRRRLVEGDEGFVEIEQAEPLTDIFGQGVGDVGWRKLRQHLLNRLAHPSRR